MNAKEFLDTLDKRMKDGKVSIPGLGDVVIVSVAPETVHLLILALQSILERHREVYAIDRDPYCLICGQSWPCWEVKMISDVLVNQ